MSMDGAKVMELVRLQQEACARLVESERFLRNQVAMLEKQVAEAEELAEELRLRLMRQIEAGAAVQERLEGEIEKLRDRITPFPGCMDTSFDDGAWLWRDEEPRT